MSSLMLLLVWLIFFMVLIKLLPILVTISGKTVKLMLFALICLGNKRQDLHTPTCIVSCLQILESFLWFVLITLLNVMLFFFSSRRRHTRFDCDWSSDVCSSDLNDTPRRARPTRCTCRTACAPRRPCAAWRVVRHARGSPRST